MKPVNKLDKQLMWLKSLIIIKNVWVFMKCVFNNSLINILDLTYSNEDMLFNSIINKKRIFIYD